jgi:hypothetical protein
MSELPVTYFINVSINKTPKGVLPYQVNNLGILTKETPLESFGTGDYGIYNAPSQVATDWGTDSETYKQAVAIFSQQPNILNGKGVLVIFKCNSSETLGAAITRTADIAYVGGYLATWTPESEELLAASDIAQASDSLLYVASNTASVITGDFTTIKSKGNDHTRCLFYSVGEKEARIMAAAYASRNQSVNFNAQNSTITMNLKDLLTIAADSGLTPTIISQCKTAGVDVYGNFGGVSKVKSHGANGYMDDVYNLIWLRLLLMVTGFNYLAQTSTKIPQTEEGMNGLKAAWTKVFIQARYNRMIAPGTWNSPNTFGNLEDFLRNIEEQGFYLYSQPISEQLQTEREQRIAPVSQAAIKFAGAIHSADLIINFNL